MPLSELQRAQTRNYLGYPDGFRLENPRLESVMDLIDSRPDQEGLLVGWLGQLADIETRLTAALASSGMMKAEDAEWYENQARIVGIRKEGTRIVGKISVMLGVDIQPGGAFSEAGYQDDWWMAKHGQGYLPRLC